MRNLREAIEVLKIIEKNGHEAFLVGGVVRDYLLKNKPNDIDITTNARPFQVMKMFKSAPTGIKYGTITIFYKDKEFQVTTYRSEEGYDDHRHPEVTFESSVFEDVKRRDFTMNGLLMNKDLDIIDLVDGKKDIRHKYIKAIGNPSERFEEDALRMLRAFYFQAKLGFEIDRATKEGIRENKHLIKEIAGERVLDEVLKMLREPHLKKALESLVELEVHKELPGLEKGIVHFSKLEDMPLTDIFFSTSFALNKRVPSYWKFPNKHKHKYRTVSSLANEDREFTGRDLYLYGLEFVLAANRVNHYLGRAELQANDLTNLYNSLPIKSSLDLKFRARDILELTNKKAGAWVNNIINEMVLLVIDNKLANDYEELKKFVAENHENF